jgi:hypothetical protein
MSRLGGQLPGGILDRAVGAAATDAIAKAPTATVTWEDLRAFCNQAAIEKGEWGGAPMPVDHVRLRMEPRYPFKGLNGKKFSSPEDKPAVRPEETDFTVLNQWRVAHRGVDVVVCREANGKITKCFMPAGAGRRFDFLMNTLGVAAGKVWDTRLEARALEKLASLITPHAYSCYVLSGTFLETSRRSGVTYVFRKLRPTVALRGDPKTQHVRPLAVLCMHPLGYYEESWAGVMCPTDDVVAHLILMRGDEHRFWKKSNHHDITDPAAGI